MKEPPIWTILSVSITITPPASAAGLLTILDVLPAQVNEVVINRPDGYLDQEVTSSCGKSLAEAMLLKVQKLLGGQPDGG
jgi:hypothetical protein